MILDVTLTNLCFLLRFSNHRYSDVNFHDTVIGQINDECRHMHIQDLKVDLFLIVCILFIINHVNYWNILFFNDTILQY